MGSFTCNTEIVDTADVLRTEAMDKCYPLPDLEVEFKDNESSVGSHQ